MYKSIMKSAGLLFVILIYWMITDVADCSGRQKMVDTSVANLYNADASLYTEINTLKVQKQKLEQQVLSDEADFRSLRLKVDQLQWEVEHPQKPYPRPINALSK